MMRTMTTTLRINRRLPWMRDAGLSLIELMVGLAIGLVLTLGLFTLIVSQSAAFKVQDDFARMQENGTQALSYLGESIRMAGFYGYGPGPGIDTAIGGVATTIDCGSAANGPALNWALDVTTPISGFNGLTPATASALLPCIDARNFTAAVPNPILITRSGAGIRIPDPTLAIYNTTVFVQSDPNAGLLFYGNNFAALKAAGNTRSTSTGANIDVFEYRPQVYYVRPCSQANGGGLFCTGAADDGGVPIPTLARQQLIGQAMTEVLLVQGIEQVAFQYGIDDVPAVGPSGGVGDGVPDRYTATPLPTEWPNVVAVRVSVLARSLGFSPGYDDSSKSYDLNGDGVPDFPPCTPGVNCGFKRKVFSQSFQIRNIAQRRGA
jgi:type IV pilus assembly protein PilW